MHYNFGDVSVRDMRIRMMMFVQVHVFTITIREAKFEQIYFTYSIL